MTEAKIMTEAKVMTILASEDKFVAAVSGCKPTHAGERGMRHGSNFTSLKTVLLFRYHKNLTEAVGFKWLMRNP